MINKKQSTFSMKCKEYFLRIVKLGSTKHNMTQSAYVRNCVLFKEGIIKQSYFDKCINKEFK